MLSLDFGEESHIRRFVHRRKCNGLTVVGVKTFYLFDGVDFIIQRLRTVDDDMVFLILDIYRKAGAFFSENRFTTGTALTEKSSTPISSVNSGILLLNKNERLK